MEQIVVRDEFEEETYNIYQVLFQKHIGRQFSILRDGEWIPVQSWISDNDKKDEYFDSQIEKPFSSIYYSGSDIIGYLSFSMVICAIAGDPHGEHFVRHSSSSSVYWVDWKTIPEIYDVVRNICILQNDWPNSLPASRKFYAINDNYWITQNLGEFVRPQMSKYGYYYYSGLESLYSTSMVMRKSFYEQAKCQIRGSSHFSLSAQRNSSRYFKAIGKYLVHCLLSQKQVFFPYVGHFLLKNNRLVFSANRLFKDRVKGIAPKENRQKRGRIYGGEEFPGQTTPFWLHHKDEDRHLLSKRRQFVIEYIEHLDMSPIPSSQWWYPDKEVWKNYSLGNICFQAYVDALFFRVINGKRVRIDDVGILYAKNNRLYFRTSSSFRNIQKKKNEGKDAH